MPLPASISIGLAALQANVNASLPLASAPRATVKSLQLDARSLVGATDAALTAAAGSLDAFGAATDPDVIAAGVVALAASAQAQSDLAQARGLIGRIASNLDQA